MFENYKLSLLDFYWIKNKNHRLSINLEDPGREKIRIECVEVFLRKNAQKDKDLIRLVFDPKNQFEDQVRSIERFKLDKFRSLVSFMVEGTSIRDEKLVKLLAWLIDFPTYNEWRELSEEELKLIFDEAAKKPEENNMRDVLINGDISEPTSDIEKPNVVSTLPPPIIITRYADDGNKGGNTSLSEPKSVYEPRFSPRYITLSCIILLLVCTASFAVWERRAKMVRMPESGEKFMYWDGDHYEPVKEGDQKPGVSIIPLDLKTLQQQRKITLPDTLTKYSLGKVWYKGYGSNHEYFTFKGVYPADTARTLRPLSNTILTKYTSNYRYLLTRLIWFLCAAFFISLCGYGVSRMKRKISVKKQVETTDDHVAAFSEVELAP